MNKRKKKNVSFYIIGSFALAAGAVIVMPKLIDYLSEQMYHPSTVTNYEDDDLGPEIVKKTDSTCENNSEEDIDGKL